MADRDYKAFIVEGEVREPQIIDNISKVFFAHGNFKIITLPAEENIYMLWKKLKGCKKLKKVVIPKTVTKIGAKAFKGDKALKTVKIKSKKIKSFGKNSFKGVKATVKVPKSKKAAYTKALKKAGFKGKVK